jgi:hypothetical protein
MTAMPKGVRAPALLGSYRTDDWVALISKTSTAGIPA